MSAKISLYFARLQKICPSEAVKNLFLYNLYVSLSITIASNFTFMDRIFIRINIDLGNLGVIKSIIFFAPAIIYQLTAPFISRLNRDKEIISLGYIFRCIVPLLLPLTAIFTDNVTLLTILSAILLPAGMLFASFANNTLMKIYRNVIPAENYNTTVNIMNMLLAIPAMVMSLPVAMVLDRYAYLDNRGFFLLYTFMQLLTLLLEIPAVLYMRKVEYKTTAPTTDSSRKKMDLLAPYRNKLCRTLLALSTVHNIAAGLGMAYITIYLLEVTHLPLASITTLTLITIVLLNLLLPVGGKLMDKYGYGKIFTLLSAALPAGMILLLIFWGQKWVLLLFAFLVWDGAASLCGGLLLQGEYAASSALPQKKWLDSAIAAFSLCSNGGRFAGLLLASPLYSWIARGIQDISTTLRWYYLLILPAFTLPFFFSLALYKISKKEQKQ